MAKIFISHSSRDNVIAMEVKAWLESQGFDQSFLDFDKHNGIDPGANWEKTLYREIDLSQAVLLILTPHWNDSKWCFAEYTQARAIGKAIFPLIYAPIDGQRIASNLQHLDLTQNKEAGLQQLYQQLRQVALDVQGGFPWDKTRSPFPGLMYFSEDDAAIFFGRDDDVRRVVERLNARRTQGGARLIALLGASGSGKSSLLRAGVLPRVKRDKKNWLVLPPFRPQKDPVHQFARVLAQAAEQPEKWKEYYERLMGDDYRLALIEYVVQIQTVNNGLEADILISLDQGEELFTLADNNKTQRFCELITAIEKESLSYFCVMTMRSDFLGHLQQQAELTERFEELSIQSIPLVSIADVIRGPAEVVGLQVEESLISAATHDAQTKDALPLLAFTLRQLYERFGSDGDLKLEEYHALGNAALGLSPLENAVRQAADDVLKNENPSVEELSALREAFVPQLVRVNDAGEYVRRPAIWDELPGKAWPLLEKLIKARLLILHQDDDKKIIEVTHEALLRKWQILQDWLNDEREFLIGKGRLEQSLLDWQQASQEDKDQALLRGLQLTRAKEWLIEHAGQLTEEERRFIQKSIDSSEADQKRREGMRKKLTWGSVTASIILALVAGFAFVQQERAIGARDDARTKLISNYWMNAVDERDDRKNMLMASYYFMNAARLFKMDDNEGFESTYLAGEILNGEMQLEVISESNTAKPTWLEFAESCPEESLDRSYEEGTVFLLDGTASVEHALVRCAVLSDDGTKVLSWGDDNFVRVWTIKGELLQKVRHNNNVHGAIFNKDQSKILTWSKDQTAILWDSLNGQQLTTEMWNGAPILRASFSPEEDSIATLDADENIRIWQRRDTPELTQVSVDDETTESLETNRLTPDCFTEEGAVYIRDLNKWKQPRLFKSAAVVLDCDFLPDDGLLLTWTAKFILQLRNIESENILYEKQENNYFSGAAILSNDKIMGWYSNGTVRIWRVSSKEQISEWIHKGQLKGAILNYGQNKMLIWDNNGVLKLLNLDTTREIFPQLKHSGVVKAVFSPDERYIVSWSLQHLKLWDAKKGVLLAPLLRHEGYIKEVRFNSSVDQIIVQMEKGVRVWNLPPDLTQRNLDLVLAQEVLTGTQLNLETSELQILNGEEWEAKKQQLKYKK